MLKSQFVREIGPEADPLWIGKGLSPSDLEKPQILIDSTYGDSHPGSTHLDALSDAAKLAVFTAQGAASCYTVTDICDGVATGHEGMNYSLISRDMIAGMVEIHAMASGYDGLITISSCDKSTPGHLMALGRLNIPGIHIPGGSMAAGPAFISADTCYETDIKVADGRMTHAEEFYVQCSACPGSGACQYMGTASTMQIMSEALGMALPGSALAPAGSNMQKRIAHETGKRIVGLVKQDLRPSDVMTRKAFENAIKVHAAVGGSTNAVLHLPAIANELGITVTHNDFQELTKCIPLLTSILTAGKWPSQYFWYAGGVPRIMLELRDFLDLGLMTVTGKTIGENLENLEASGFFRRSEEYMRNLNRTIRDIIKPVDDPEDEDSGITILTGNIAPGGAVIKHCAVDKSMYDYVGKVKVFDSEQEAVKAIYEDQISPGEIVVVRYCGVKAAGMPEMLKATDAICNKPALDGSCALITDGRFSGATRGPSIGYLLPEAAEGGPIAYLKDGDIVKLDVRGRTIDMIGFDGKEKAPAEVAEELKSRAETVEIKTFKHKGVLRYLDI